MITVREKNAEIMLREWMKLSNAQVQLDGNRVRIYEHHSLSLFQMHWTGDWDNVVIWDCWNKRHIIW
jgi:hypothetical protein